MDKSDQVFLRIHPENDVMLNGSPDLQEAKNFAADTQVDARGTGRKAKIFWNCFLYLHLATKSVLIIYSFILSLSMVLISCIHKIPFNITIFLISCFTFVHLLSSLCMIIFDKKPRLIIVILLNLCIFITFKILVIPRIFEIFRNCYVAVEVVGVLKNYIFM
jgi:hypothetical protein